MTPALLALAYIAIAAVLGVLVTDASRTPAPDLWVMAALWPFTIMVAFAVIVFGLLVAVLSKGLESLGWRNPSLTDVP